MASLVESMPEELRAALADIELPGHVKNFESLCGCPFNWHLGMMKCNDSCPVKGLRNHTKFPPFVLLPPGSGHLDQMFFGDRRGLEPTNGWCFVGEIVRANPPPSPPNGWCFDGFPDRKDSIVKTAFGEEIPVILQNKSSMLICGFFL